MFKQVSPRVDVPALEQSILEYWKARGIIDQILAEPDDGRRFVFYEGPPTANGKPHIGHVLPRAMKDLIPRYQFMHGHYVPRKAGWDTHGLPVELEVEKQLGISGKPGIESYGVEEFINHCRQSVWTYKKEWEDLTERIGFWLDLESAYITYDEGYIESVWWALRKIWDRGLLYRGHKVLPYCARCGCALSSHELAQGYTETEDPSVFVRFPLVEDPDASLAVWTTTPWTLISNVAAAVSADDEYAEVETGHGKLILARALVETVLGDVKVNRVFPGSELVGKQYAPPYKFVEPDRKAHYVVAADFVTLEDGTGIVHLAPAFGEDDMRIGVQYDLPVLQPVDAEGRFTADIEPFAGQFVKDADPAIIDDLDQRGLLLKSETYTHTYPMCWRCDTPLLYYARSAWFIRVTEIRDELIANNRTINWHPEHMRDGRFGHFLEGAIDWCLSRERYWGTPLNIWVCGCGHEHCVGSVEELKQMSSRPLDTVSLHKPGIDAVTLACPECSGEMRRVPEVIDCWFDSGAMPFAQYHYPFENRELFERNFPADFICEAIDQTRGWFYSLLVISTIVFGRAPYRTVLVTEHGLDDEGMKMSKHKGNVLDPWTVLNKQGADALRWFLYSAGPPWYPKRFSEETISDLYSQTLGTLWNVYVFFTLYASIDQYDPATEADQDAYTVLDRWILSRLSSTTEQVDNSLAGYDINGGARAITAFVDDLSNWYVRRSRRRFWKTGVDADKLAAFSVLYRTLTVTARLLAPYTPFLAEELYRNLVLPAQPSAPASIHLTSFPAADQDAVDPELERQMGVLREFVRLGRAARNRVNIRVRQPLPLITLVGEDAKQARPLIDILLDELNVKRADYVTSLDQLCSYKLKLKFEVAGARYGPLTPRLAAYLSGLEDDRAAAAVATLTEAGELPVTIGDEQVTLPGDAIDILREIDGERCLEGDDQRAVVLNTGITPELRREGLARELVNRIERMRKDAGFDVQDQIVTYFRVKDDILVEAIREHGSYIAAETLSRQLVPAGTVDVSGLEENTLHIDGMEVWLGLARD